VINYVDALITVALDNQTKSISDAFCKEIYDSRILYKTESKEDEKTFRSKLENFVSFWF
jgi:hypothetical protein